MRPLVVLSLVIALVAILLVTLFSVGSEEAPPVSPSTPLAGNPAPSNPGLPPGAAEDTGEDSVGDALHGDGPAREELEALLPRFENALVGTVRDPNGEPVADVRLTLEERKLVDGGLQEVRRTFGGDAGSDDARRTGVTDAQGRYRFRELVPGRYTLGTEHPAYSRSLTFPGVGPRGESTHDVVLTAGVVLQGYVRTPKGEPIPGSTVELLHSSPEVLFAPRPRGAFAEESQTRAPDANGLYRFTNVSAGVELQLTARAPGYGTQTTRNLAIDPARELLSHNFRMLPGEPIAGSVLARDGTPIAGALVEAIGYQEPQTTTSRATTSAEGRFELVDLVAGSYFLKVEAAGFGTAQLHTVEAPSRGLEVRLDEEGGVRGRVVGPDGEPVTSFRATLHPYIESAQTYGRADAPATSFQAPDGAFALSGGGAVHVVRVEAEAFAAGVSRPFEVVPGVFTEGVVVELGLGGTITGRVIDAGTGEALANALVSTRDNHYMDNVLTRLASQAAIRRTTPRETRTDSNGRFDLDLLSPETYQLVVEHPRYAAWVKRDVAVVQGKVTDVDRIALEAGAVVHGKVVDQLGRPLVGALVKIAPSGAEAFLGETVSGSDGAYLFHNVPPGSYWLNASRSMDGANPFQDMGDLQNSKVEIRVTRGGEHAQDLYVTKN